MTMAEERIVREIHAALEKDTVLTFITIQLPFPTGGDLILAGEVEISQRKNGLSWQRRKLKMFNESSTD
jgi:hypothetical protein